MAKTPNLKMGIAEQEKMELKKELKDDDGKIRLEDLDEKLDKILDGDIL